MCERLCVLKSGTPPKKRKTNAHIYKNERSPFLASLFTTQCLALLADHGQTRQWTALPIHKGEGAPPLPSFKLTVGPDSLCLESLCSQSASSFLFKTTRHPQKETHPNGKPGDALQERLKYSRNGHLKRGLLHGIARQVGLHLVAFNLALTLCQAQAGFALRVKLEQNWATQNALFSIWISFEAPSKITRRIYGSGGLKRPTSTQYFLGMSRQQAIRTSAAKRMNPSENTRNHKKTQENTIYSQG